MCSSDLDEEEVVEDDYDNDVDAIMEEVEMVGAQIQWEEDEDEIESDVEEPEEIEVVNEDLETETETEEEVDNVDGSEEGEEEVVENVDVSAEKKVDEEQTMEEEEEEEKERVTARFVVYKIDFLKQKLARVHNLKDHTLFTGFNTSFLLSAKDFLTLIPNSIYHTDDLNHNTFSKRFSDRCRTLIDQGLRHVLIFNMKDSSFTNIEAPNSSRLNCPPPVWIQP